VYAFAATLTAFLVFAGLGSGMAARLEPTEGGGRWLGGLDLLVLVIAGLALLPTLAAPRLLTSSAGLATIPRGALVLVLIAPLAFAMGLPFPLVLARLKVTVPSLVPWAWGVNGCASVIAAVLAGLLAMSVGARSVLLLGVLAYALAAVAQRRLGCSLAEGGAPER